jgi:menaquinol-cytochrome c reductase iron-sulfur subunit
MSVDVERAPVELPVTEDRKLLQRRTFLRWATALGAVASAALVGVPGLRAFLSPAFSRRAALSWTKLAEVAAVEIGVPAKFDFTEEVNDAWVATRVTRSVWLYTSDGAAFTAFNARCTHLGCGYAYDASAKIFRCPCHEGRFNVQTGARLGGPPPRALDKLQVKVVDGSVYVAYQDFRLGVPDSVPA